jgi:hypothetical protein
LIVDGIWIYRRGAKVAEVAEGREGRWKRFLHRQGRKGAKVLRAGTMENSWVEVRALRQVGFWMKRNAEGSEGAEEDAEEE